MRFQLTSKLTIFSSAGCRFSPTLIATSARRSSFIGSIGAEILRSWTVMEFLKAGCAADIGGLAETSTRENRQHSIHHLRSEAKIVVGRGETLDGGAIDAC